MTQVMPDSNERQVATTLDGIRADHVARYRYAQCVIQRLCDKPELITACDFGCGVGYGTSLLRQVTRAVFGFDRDEATLCFARDHWKSEGIAFVRHDLEQGAPAVSMDVAVAFEVIEHLRDPAPFLTTLVANTLIGSVPNEAAFPWSPDIAHHYRHYTLDQISELLARCGWEVESWGLQVETESNVTRVVPNGRTIDGLAEKARTICFTARRAEGANARAAAEMTSSVAYAHPTGKTPETVMLCGLGPSKAELTEAMLRHDYAGFADELWTVNKGLTLLPRADVAFIMDDIDDYAQRHPAYGAEMAAYQGRIIGQTLFPAEVEARGIAFTDFPLRDVLAFWGGNCQNWLHTISLGYILAYAGFIGVKRLLLAGVDCSWPNNPSLTEAGNAVVCYWIGRLTQAGCEVVINSASVLNETRRQGDYDYRRFYGYLRQPQLDGGMPWR